MYEDLIDKLRRYAAEYRSGKTLGRAIEGTEDVMEAAVAAIEALSLRMPQWVSVKDKLPEDNKRVLLHIKNPYGPDGITIGYRGRRALWDGTFSAYEWVAISPPLSSSGCVIDKNHKGVCSIWAEVTHWLPLPDPPKEE